MREVDAYRRRASPRDPTLYVRKIRYRYSNERSDRYAKAGFDTAAAIGAIRYLYRARLKLIGRDGGLPIHHDTDRASLIFSRPSRSGEFERSHCHSESLARATHAVLGRL